MATQLVIESRIKGNYQSSTCPFCKSSIEFLPPEPRPDSFLIKCAKCSKTYQGPAKPKSSSGKSRGRQIGSDDNPIDMSYYEILGVSHNATLQEIKSAYRRLAIKCHPDKNLDDPEAENKFKAIATAYSTLSDPELRHKYNEFGKSQGAGAEEGAVDPEAVFSSLFGGEKFADIIGTVSIGSDMKAAMQQDEGEEGQVAKKQSEMTPEEKQKKAEEDRKQSEEKARVREERVQKLEANLKKKLMLFTMQARGPDDEEIRASVRGIWSIEAEELKNESYGPELLQTVGFVYSAKARHYMASDSTLWGVGGWLHSAKSTAHVFSETWSTLRTALDLQTVFRELAAAEDKGLTEEQRKELEEKAAAKALLALFKGAKLEIESVIREVCDRILSEPNVSREELRLRIAAMEILGSVYSAVQKDESVPTLADAIKNNLQTRSSSAPPPTS